ncbi:MAG: hypothetical protein Q7J15_04780 [Candidatus Desulfaltia sp.]|nr:hypothetical protein [Candidatus Desulfaltia sp.]
MNVNQKIIVVMVDILILAELAYCIMQGKSNPEYMTPIFFKNFIPLIIATLIGSKILLKRFRTEEIVSATNNKAINPG